MTVTASSTPPGSVPAGPPGSSAPVAANRRPRARNARQVEENARNRAEIVRAALQVFAERGYAATTLEAVARLVGLTRPGVLHHFVSKEALFAEVIADQEQWARRQFGRDDRPDLEGTVLQRLQILLPFIGREDSARVRLQMVQVLQAEAMSGNPAAVAFARQRLRNVRRHIRDILEEAQEAGELRSGVDVPALATLLSAAINGLQAQWLLDDSVDTRAAFDHLLALVSTA